ncbi:hypothetical protein AMTR_s00169p00021520 [Amborella trichopoda]|uniref:Uncharacterized protein n=1 Tax=Amborella trichopoda TaxID=13333 RepID=W1PPX5_AMBTC|nr:hypothetical protein AMTR_s00169p00021520 [Amborella trichopoda]
MEQWMAEVSPVFSRHGQRFVGRSGLWPRIPKDERFSVSHFPHMRWHCKAKETGYKQQGQCPSRALDFCSRVGPHLGVYRESEESGGRLDPGGTGRELNGEEAMVWAAEAIGNVIRKGRADPLGDAKTWLSWFTQLVGSWYLLMAGSPRISICEMGFGWGRLRRVEVVSIDKEGGIALAVAREEEGGVEVSLSLRSSEMHELESLFFKGLNEA